MEAVLIDKTEAAKSLSISVRQLELHIARGEIAVRRIGRRCVRIERREIDRFVRSLPREAADVLAC